MTTPETQGSAAATANVRVVQDFLAAMERNDQEATFALCAPDMVWINHPFTTTRNKEQFEKLMRKSFPEGSVFQVRDMKIHERPDGVVATDRVDILDVAGLKMRIPVQGDFVVEDGRITRWEDRFPWPSSTLQVVKSLPSMVRYRLRGR